MLFFLWSLLLVKSRFALRGPELSQPPVVDFNENTPVEDFVARYHEFEIKNRSNVTLIKFWTRAYCWGPCTIPAATFVMYPGIPAKLRICNALQGFGPEHLTDQYIETMGYTPYKDTDVVNLHVHGLHVSPDEDDVLTRRQAPFCPPGYNSSTGRGCIEPNDTRTNYDCTFYNFTLPDYHYPGSHWWHTHQHGSVEMQVAGGLYGAILVENPKASQFQTTMDSSWLVLSYFYGMKNGKCNPDSCDAGRNSPKPGSMSPMDWLKREGGFPLTSRCSLQCYYLLSDKMASGLNQTIYNPQNIDHEIYLVNGQMEPTKTLQTGQWHRFRIVSSSVVYLFLKVPNTTDCDFYLMGQDGIDFTEQTSVADGYNDGTGPRDINAAPHFGTVVVPIGGRADVAVRCRKSGTYQLKALSAPKEPRSDDVHISDQFSAENRAALSELSTTSTDCLTTQLAFWMPTPSKDLLLLDLLVEGDDKPNIPPAAPQVNNPPYKSCDYLADTRKTQAFTVDTTQPNIETAMKTSNIVFPARPFRGNGIDGPAMATGMNNVTFRDSTPMFQVQTGVVHEWTVFIRFHPFHHHTWPFQVKSSFPDFTGNKNPLLRSSTGWWVRGGDWRDVLGIYGSLVVRVNYVASGPEAPSILDGKLVIHCHFVFHEDFGMMQWYHMNTSDIAPLHYSPNANLTIGEHRFEDARQLCDSINGNLTKKNSDVVVRAGKVKVVSNVLSNAFGFELGQLGTNGTFYAIFDGRSRLNVHNFYVGYGVSSDTTLKCGTTAQGIALRLQVFKNSSTATTHQYQAVPVNINPPHVEASLDCVAALQLQCETPRETELIAGKMFKYRVVCTFKLPTTDVCGTMMFRDVFLNASLNVPLIRPFFWSYGEGLGSSQFPEYSNQNVQTCHIMMRTVPVDKIFGGGKIWEATCQYNYFNLVSRDLSLVNFSVCSAFDTPVVVDRASEGPGDARKGLSGGAIVGLVIGILVVLAICVFAARYGRDWMNNQKYENLDTAAGTSTKIQNDPEQDDSQTNLNNDF